MLRIVKKMLKTYVPSTPCAIATVSAAAAGGGCPLALCCASADSLLGDGCRVMSGSVVKNSVLGSCAFIDDHCYIQVRAYLVAYTFVVCFLGCL